MTILPRCDRPHPHPAHDFVDENGHQRRCHPTPKADQTAADRLLKAAVRQAIDQARDGVDPEPVLATAGAGAALLLGEVGAHG